MLSRIAESLFWIGRYVERADGTARLVDVLRLQLLEDPSIDEAEASNRVLAVIMGMPLGGPVDFRDVADKLVFDLDNPSAIGGALMSARENARRAREIVSTELWEAINVSWHNWRGFNQRSVTAEHLAWVRFQAGLLAGVTDSSMSHDDAWRFMVLGRLLERADMTARLVATGGVNNGAPWPIVLASCGGQQAFLRSHRGMMSDDAAAAYLVLDRLFPRSVLFCLLGAEEQLEALSPEPERLGVSDTARRQLGGTRARLEFAETEELLTDLPRLMLEVQTAVKTASYAIRARYFHSGPATTWTGEYL